FSFQRSSCGNRQRLKRAAYNHDGVSLHCMPGYAFHAVFKKTRDGPPWVAVRRQRYLSLALACLTSPKMTVLVLIRIGAILNAPLIEALHPTQIHLVRVHHAADSTRNQFRRFAQPQEIVRHWNFSAITQHSKELPFERRQRQQRSIQIEKGSHSRAHAAS